MTTLRLNGKHTEKEVILDKEDYGRVAQYKWYYHDGYAATNYGRRTLYMHRLIAKTPAGKHTDHINGNKLDNRKENLKICTHAENMQNHAKRGCIKKMKAAGNTYWYGEIRALGKRFITTTCENEEQAKGALKQMIKERDL